MTLTQIKAVLNERGLRPLKRFGQNFLHDQNLVQTIIRSALDGMGELSSVVEIGPGLGAITEFLLAGGIQVTAIELDKGLSEFLRERFINETRFTFIEGDALKIELTPQTMPRLLIGNLPYYISTPLIARWMECPQPPDRMVFTLQKEVAERLAAQSGENAYGGFSVIVQTEYRVECLRSLPPDVFYPRPEVDSTVVRLDRISTPFSDSAQAADFREFIRKGFSQRRKKLSNTLRINDDRRPEQVSPTEWLILWKSNN